VKWGGIGKASARLSRAQFNSNADSLVAVNDELQVRTENVLIEQMGGPQCEKFRITDSEDKCILH
jgi:hypothetical protein